MQSSVGNNSSQKQKTHFMKKKKVDNQTIINPKNSSAPIEN